MEVSAQSAGLIGLDSSAGGVGMRPLPGAAEGSGPTIQSGAQPTGLSGQDMNFGVRISTAIDKLRSDFSMSQFRINKSNARGVVGVSSDGGRPTELSTAMDTAVKTQVHLMQSSIAFHLGVTGVQQSQAGVKTLLEKS